MHDTNATPDDGWGTDDADDDRTTRRDDSVSTPFVALLDSIDRGEQLSSTTLLDLLNSGYEPRDIGRVIKELGIELGELMHAVNASDCDTAVKAVIVSSFVDTPERDRSSVVTVMPTFDHCRRTKLRADQGDITVLAA